jgi:hypothetical protein
MNKALDLIAHTIKEKVLMVQMMMMVIMVNEEERGRKE